MSLTIKSLTPELAADFFDFFDNRAFADNSPMQPCYCCRPQMTKEQEQTELISLIKENTGVIPRDIPHFKLTLRRITERQIQEGTLQGYLAFNEGVSIGWCNANNKGNYTLLGISNDFRSAYTAKPDECVKSVLCFEIARIVAGKALQSLCSTVFVKMRSQKDLIRNCYIRKIYTAHIG